MVHIQTLTQTYNSGLTDIYLDIVGQTKTVLLIGWLFHKHTLNYILHHCYDLNHWMCAYKSKFFPV